MICVWSCPPVLFGLFVLCHLSVVSPHDFGCVMNDLCRDYSTEMARGLGGRGAGAFVVQFLHSVMEYHLIDHSHWDRVLHVYVRPEYPILSALMSEFR